MVKQLMKHQTHQPSPTVLSISFIFNLSASLSTLITLPAYSLIIFPSACSLAAIHIFDKPFAMTSIVLPISEVPFAIFPSICPITLFDIIVIHALILLAFRPHVYSSSMHFALGPFSSVASTVKHF